MICIHKSSKLFRLYYYYKTLLFLLLLNFILFCIVGIYGFIYLYSFILAFDFFEFIIEVESFEFLNHVGKIIYSFKNYFYNWICDSSN